MYIIMIMKLDIKIRFHHCKQMTKDWKKKGKQGFYQIIPTSDYVDTLSILQSVRRVYQKRESE